LSISIKTNNNAVIWMFVGKILGGLDGLYTPKGNVRLSFVDHGADLSHQG
jgi:hypothetical protein